MSEEQQKHLGFERTVPGLTGEVTILTPEAEQLEKARARVEAAAERLGMIERVSGPDALDEVVAGLVEEANESSQITQEEKLGVVGVGVSEVQTHPDDSLNTARELDGTSVEDLKAALQDLNEVEGVDAVEVVVGAIEAAAVDQTMDVQDELKQEPSGERKDVPELPYETVSELMDAKDPDDRTRHALKLLEDEIGGKVRLDVASIRAIFEKAPLANFQSLISNGSAEVIHLTQRIAEIPSRHLSTSEVINQQLHAQNLKLIERQVGGDALTWRTKERAGEDIPPAAKEYIAQGQIASLYLHNVEQFYTSGFKADSSPESIDHHLEVYRKGSERAIEYALDIADDNKTETNPVRAKMARAFMYGDINLYGFNTETKSDGKSHTFINNRGLEGVRRYVASIDRLGSDGAEALHESFGIINFGRYEPKLMASMADMLEHPPVGRELSVILIGQSGDHNGAFVYMMRGQKLENTVVYEVETAEQTAATSRSLDTLGGKYTHLTIAGHGAIDGLHLSQSLVLGGNLYNMAHNPVNDIIERLEPNESGDSEVLLYSCSQGKRYGGRKSTAEVLSDVHRSRVRVQAAPDVMHAVPTGEAGEHKMYNEPLVELTERLAKSSPYVRKLLARIALQYQGKVIVENGRRKRTRNGNVRIGA